MKEPDYAKLVEYKRNGLVEQVHFGLIVHIDKKGVVSKTGEDNSYKFYHRSCMKPLQSSALTDLGLDKKYNLSLEEIALCCASHAGDLIHLEHVLSVLKKTGFNQTDLLCRPIEPLSRKEKERLIKNNLEFTPLHNNCSGKHAAMLAICREKGFPTNNYTDIDNPLSTYILNHVCNLCETDIKNTVISKDGCGLPVIATTLEELGRGFLNLFTSGKYEKIARAFLSNPFLIGGEKRLDSEIMYSDDTHTLVAKTGACGLCVVVNIKKEECVVVKIADSNMQARAISVVETLKQLKWPNNSNEFFDRLNFIYSKDILSQQGELQGNINPCFKIC